MSPTIAAHPLRLQPSLAEGQVPPGRGCQDDGLLRHVQHPEVRRDEDEALLREDHLEMGMDEGFSMVTS